MKRGEDEEEREREKKRERGERNTPCIVKCGARRLYEMNVKIPHTVPVLTCYRT